MEEVFLAGGIGRYHPSAIRWMYNQTRGHLGNGRTREDRLDFTLARPRRSVIENIVNVLSVWEEKISIERACKPTVTVIQVSVIHFHGFS